MRTQTPSRGFILIFTFMLMIAVALMAGAMLYMITYETRSGGIQTDDLELLSLADAGVERAHRVIRDDYLTTTQTGTSDLRGADTSLSVSITNPNNMRYIDSQTATINDGADEAILRTFDSNYTNTRIISVVLGARASRGGGSGSNPTIEVSYTTDGANYTAAITQTLTTGSTTSLAADITGSLTWQALMSSNFRLRSRRTGGTRDINLDSMYLRVTYTIDTLTEPWATGSYAVFPVTLGGGTIQSVSITDESGKVHLNYAPQALLTNLLQNLSISNAGTKAANIVSYRGAGLTNPFDSVEELQQVTGITASDYTAIKGYVTAYSFVNQNVYRPAGPRAPINVNTASYQVLKSVFDSLSLGAGDPANLANDIISSRPFAGFYSSTSNSQTYFYNFVNARPYLSAVGSPDEVDRVLDNADASSLVPVEGATGFNAVTTEFCYAAGIFGIDSLANVNNRGFRVKTLRGNDGSHTFATFIGDTTSVGYRKENFE